MSIAGHDRIFSLICEHCRIAYRGSNGPERYPQNFDLDSPSFLRLNLMIGHMHGAARVWTKPGAVEADIEDARKKLATAMEAVRALDGYAKSLARNEADKGREGGLHARLAEIAEAGLSSDEQRCQTEKACEAYEPQPIEEWVDHAALSAMEKLRDALVHPIERAIPNAPTGPGRPPNRRAYAVADFAYRIFTELTGMKPTFWNGGETSFSRLVADLYAAYGIQSTLRKPIEAAMHKYEDAA